MVYIKRETNTLHAQQSVKLIAMFVFMEASAKSAVWLHNYNATEAD